jgi:spore coat polysaccharide biosynthesis protein SpsF
MNANDVLIVVQARMSSSRFPGKVLAPLRGEPVLRHVVRTAQTVEGARGIVVATSTEPSDDPVAVYAASLGVSVVRGPLDDVLERFRSCARLYPADWLMRINGDSPMLPAGILARVLAARDGGRWDLVTTVFPRTFAPGQNVELIRTSTLLALADGRLTPADREHVTAFFYRNADEFLIRNVECDSAERASSYAVDTLDDLRRLDQLGRVVG